MIAERYIQEWKEFAPWPASHQVEQDLIISRVLCELYSDTKIQASLAFRGGTSLQKIFFKQPTRYSEDIDLVQIPKEPIGEVINAIRKKLDSWLGKPNVALKTGRVTLRYKFRSEIEPQQNMKLKIETNNAEHFCVLGHRHVPYEVTSSWFSGKAQITTFQIEEIMGTKLRALYQRKKGRDLFDFQKAFEAFPEISDKKVIECFTKYLQHAGHAVSRAEFEMAISEKQLDQKFREDIAALLPEGETFDADSTFSEIQRRLISQLPGEAWKGSSRQSPE